MGNSMPTAYGGEWRTECARAGRRTECARAEWRTQCARGDWHSQCARGDWHSQCARGWHSQCAGGGCGSQWAGAGSFRSRVWYHGRFDGLCGSCAGTGTPKTIPSLGSPKYDPSPRDDPPTAEARGSNPPEAGADDDSWGRWTAPSLVQNVVAREPKRPRRGLPAGVRVDLSPIPVPGEAEDRLLRELFRQEQERRIEEAMALGIHLRPGEGEPRPLLSHYFDQPAAVEDIYDSLSQALTIRDRSFLTRISLGQGASSRFAWEARRASLGRTGWSAPRR